MAVTLTSMLPENLEKQLNELCKKLSGKPLWSTTSIVKDEFKVWGLKCYQQGRLDVIDKIPDEIELSPDELDGVHRATISLEELKSSLRSEDK